tara:strand:- start:2498 stop:2770 length:273 start_codon:yes stop_codon:yes gene_type:complete
MMLLQFKLYNMEDVQKVRDYVALCIEGLEKHNYAKVCDGYLGDSGGGVYDNAVQRHSGKIVSKLVSLGYIYTTNHGFGCYDWTFCKDFEI